ncbi:hypothetical protein X762_01470 [Mesorhizobium sp. LSHC426A00]|nr:hypothetical protein X762_01470 [Mesorhizobium sp. LSHC426A00]ESX59314.1 hypothetical protein X761_03340 [Mesorhizobium sp. LSHC424B00]ESX76173.1 hypothetical protein X758_00415 [Mesorhizobium sp. LSHC416B00]ESZ50880.1 hypothetical protein X730_06910 [Mesorhizobium sp. L103C565B0]
MRQNKEIETRPIAIIILWRSKERSDAAQTIESMP